MSDESMKKKWHEKISNKMHQTNNINNNTSSFFYNAEAHERTFQDHTFGDN
jgi:hypothetical protein